MSTTPAGWYPDPKGRAQQRWYDGTTWTDFVKIDGQSFVDDGLPAPNPNPIQAQPAPPVAPVGVAHIPVQKAPRSANQKMAIVAVVALVAGGVLGYVVRGGGDSGGGGGGSGGTVAGGALSTPLLEGLASLDTYEWNITVASVGPTAGDHTEMTGTGASDSAKELRYMKMTNTSVSADDTDGPSTGTTETWRAADSSCSFDGEEYSRSVTNPFESDIGTVLSGVFDIVIPKGNAKKVGTEKVAGIDADHYTFTIEGLGGGSGAQVEANSGEVWIAQDGGYVLRYTVTAKMVDSAQGGEEYSLTVTLEMTSVNQSVSITMPDACANAPMTTG